MRKIKFRGKSTATGKWVFGGIKWLTDGRYFIIYRQGMQEDFSDEVIPESIGQFTGLKDKNGVEIFEGDIVEFFDKVGAVHFYGAAFVFGEFPDTHDLWESMQIEVIGSIFDNPELLEDNQ